MKNIKKFFEDKKLAHKFSKAGPGSKLKDETNRSSGKGYRLSSEPTSSQEPSSSRLPVSSSATINPAKLSAAEAAERRMQSAQQQQKQTTVKMISYKNYPKAEPEEESVERESSLPKDSASTEREKLPSKQAENEDDRHTFNCPALELSDFRPLPELKNMMEEKIRSDFGGEPIIMGALLIRNCNSELTANTCISTLELILNNLRTEDSEKWEKFRKIRKAKIVNKILDVNGGTEFFEGIGFQLDDEGEWYVFDGSMDTVVDRVDYFLDILKSSDRCQVQVNRNSRIIDLNKVDISHEELDDAFFELAPDELSKEQRGRREAIERMQTFMTREMRAKYEPKRVHIITKYTRIRYKTVDSLMIEATFYTKETIRDMLEFLKTHHSISNVENYDVICGTESIPIESWTKSFQELGLYPTATFHQRPRIN